MHIVVPIKQVPETSNVRMSEETGTMIRSGVEMIVNPLDLYALESALRLRELHGGRITAISMGPPPAAAVVREAIAMGCDDGVLLSDRAFGGADTWATSYTLAEAIRARGDYDLIIAGERATDGDTAQVGPGIAAWLDIPLVTYATSIVKESEGKLVAERLVEEGYQVLEVPTPALITVVKEIAAPRLPTLAGKRRAREIEIPVLGAADLSIDPASVGLKGSPTKVVKIGTPRVTRGGTTVVADDESRVGDAVEQLIGFLRDRSVL